jgi:hypothetical protein
MLEAHVNINPVLNQFGSAYSSDILAMLTWLFHVEPTESLPFEMNFCI